MTKRVKRKHKKTGRPTKLTPELAVKIFFLAERGLTDKQIAQMLDIGESTINDWKKDPEFMDSRNSGSFFQSMIGKKIRSFWSP